MVWGTVQFVCVCVALCIPCLVRVTVGDTVCSPAAAGCLECLLADTGCRWCPAINACALLGDFVDGPNNCSQTAVNISSSCPPGDLVLTTPTPTTTPKKLRCSAARAVLPEEECSESLLDEEADRRGSIMVILPLLAAILGIFSFFLMVFIWIRCFYNKQVQRDQERDSGLQGVTEMTHLNKDDTEAGHGQNGT